MPTLADALKHDDTSVRSTDAALKNGLTLAALLLICVVAILSAL
jgi:hypothetical protein